MTYRAVISALLLVLLFLLSACTTPTPTATIAFSSTPDGNDVTYVIGADGRVCVSDGAASNRIPSSRTHLWCLTLVSEQCRDFTGQ